MKTAMKNAVLRSALCMLTLGVLCAPAQASTWQICRLELRITDIVRQPSARLQAQVVNVRPASSTVQCPQVGSTIIFTPETADYQSVLARRKWPAKGQSVQIDYRYLDGICKGDGNDHPCRIEHYPSGRR